MTKHAGLGVLAAVGMGIAGGTLAPQLLGRGVPVQAVPVPHTGDTALSRETTPGGPMTKDERRRTLESVAGVPLHFARNDGQAPSDVRFVARGPGYTVALRGTDALITLSNPVRTPPADDTERTIGLGLRGASVPTSVVGFDELAGRLNIVRGNDPARWQQGIPTFERVRYGDVYPGIDLVYYGNQRQLQYDFRVAPGARPADIALDVRGTDLVTLDTDGNLELHVGGQVLRQHKPFTYQVVDGQRREVPSRFALDGDAVTFEVGSYDASRELVIDPVIAYASWFGASGEEGVLDLAVDADGGIVVYGYSHDLEGALKFPTTPGAAKASRGSDHDAFVTKFTANGSALVFSTLLGGSGHENFSPYYTGGLALDAAGNVYVTGTTLSTDFPTTAGAFDQTRNNPGVPGNDDGFYAKLSSSGGLLYGTYIGGNAIDIPWGLDVDGAGNVYIVGRTGSQTGADPGSGGFTIAGQAYDSTFNGSSDLFLMRFDAAGTLTYSTYIGGSSSDAIQAADVKASRTTTNVVYVVSDAGNSSFPTTASRYQSFVGGGPDGVLVRMDLSLAPASQLTYGTFFGGNGSDYLVALALDSADRVYVAGMTNAITVTGAPTWSGSIASSGTDVIVAKFDTAATGASSLVYGLRMNGYYTDEADDIALDSLDQAWVTVSSGSLASTPDPTRDFPLKNTLSTTRSGNGQHPVVFQVNAAGNDVLLSSLIGGDSAGAPHVAVAVNASGEVWIGSSSGGDVYGSYDYLGLVAPYDASYNGGDSDVTLERIGKQADLSITKTVDKPYPAVTVLPGENMTYTITVSNPGDPVSNLVVTDNLPSQVSFVSCSATLGGVCAGSGANRTVSFPSIGTGQSGVITLVVRVNDDVGPNTVWTNTASFTVGGVTDPNGGNNTGGGGGANGNGGGGVPAVTNPTADADGDGLPNGWEQTYGLNPLSNSPANGASGDPDADGKTNIQEYQEGTHPRGFVITYLAEGATGALFSTRISIANPTTSQALVLTRFQKGDGTTVPKYQVVPPLSRATIDVATDPDTTAQLATAEFSTLVEADQQVVVDRTMKWPVTGSNAGYGAHAERGILTKTATTWYLAEGATFGNFDLFYLVQNPNSTDANVEVTYLLPNGVPPVVKTYTMKAQSRSNIWVDTEGPALQNAEVSAIVRSTNGVPIIVERAMYLTSPGQLFSAGHESAGVTSTATSWFLAEGATGDFFDLFILVANPNPQPAALEARYLLQGGQVITKSYTAAANSRFNIWVDLEDPALKNAAVSTTITSTNGVPVIVERAMWWPGPTAATWNEAHNSPGSTETGVKWAMGEGEVGGASAAQTYILIANTSPFGGTGRVTLLFDGAPPVTREFPLDPSSRTNVDVAAAFPEAAGRVFGAVVESVGASPAQIVVERAVYYNAGGVTWAAGTNALATRLQ